MQAKSKSNGAFEPKLTAFVCNWCTYTGADLAGTSRLQMATNVRIIRLPCTGRIDPLFILKAFERGLVPPLPLLNPSYLRLSEAEQARLSRS